MAVKNILNEELGQASRNGLLHFGELAILKISIGSSTCDTKRHMLVNTKLTNWEKLYSYF